MSNTNMEAKLHVKANDTRFNADSNYMRFLTTSCMTVICTFLKTFHIAVTETKLN